MIVGLICLLLGTLFLLFRSRIFILMGRLANLELPASVSRWTGSEALLHGNAEPWNWYRVWMNALLHPSPETWQVLSSEKGVSFKKAYLWLTVTSLLFPLVSSIVMWIKFPQAFNPDTIAKHARNIVLAGLYEPISFMAVDATIHLLAQKWLGGRGDYRSFFVVFAASYAPISVLYTFAALLRWSFESRLWMYIGLLFNYYFLLFVFTEIISFTYQIDRKKAFFLNVLVTGVAYAFEYWIYRTTGFGI